MRIVFRGSLAPLAIVAVVAMPLLLLLLAVPGPTETASAGTQLVVSQEAVTAKPYDLVLAPDGEFRILHFDAGLVGSVLVAKPWLLTVLIQGSDVVLQAKATSGATQLVVYVGDTGTLWQVAIAAHGPAPTRIVVAAPGEEPTATPPSSSSQPIQAATPERAQDPRLTAFLQTLSSEQRRGV